MRQARSERASEGKEGGSSQEGRGNEGERERASDRATGRCRELKEGAALECKGLRAERMGGERGRLEREGLMLQLVVRNWTPPCPPHLGSCGAVSRLAVPSPLTTFLLPSLIFSTSGYLLTSSTTVFLLTCLTSGSLLRSFTTD